MHRVALFLIIFLIPDIVFSQLANPCGVGWSKKYRVNSDNGINLRDKPSINGKILIAIPNNKILLTGANCDMHRDIIDGKSGAWIKTTYKEFTGFVWNGFLIEEENNSTIRGQYGYFWNENEDLIEWNEDAINYGLFRSYDEFKRPDIYKFVMKSIDKESLKNPPLPSKDNGLPIFILSGIGKDTNFISGQLINRMLFPGDQERISALSKSYIFYALGEIEKNTENFPIIKSINNYELRLYGNDLGNEPKDLLLFKTNIHAWGAGGFENDIFLKWAGDLNFDGNLDIIIGYSFHYAGGTYKLFLSNTTDPNEGIYKEIDMGSWQCD